MPANTAPLFPLTPINAGFAKLTAANTATDGTGTVATVYTAGANGGRLDALLFKALGTNVQTVARIFLNNGSDTTTATNNTLIAEIMLPATTASNTEMIGADIRKAIGLSLQAGYKVLVVIATAVSAGWQITPVAGDY